MLTICIQYDRINTQSENKTKTEGQAMKYNRIEIFKKAHRSVKNRNRKE